MLHPWTVVKTVDDVVGVGVFATHRIPRGTVTWVRDPLDRTLSATEVARLDTLRRAVLDTYAWEEDGTWILCWDNGRFVNHACDANCFGLGVPYDVAVRDIEVGEQLTNDYRALGIDHAFTCGCGAPTCSGRVRPEDRDALLPGWARQQAAAILEMHAVEQPLAPWIPAPSVVPAQARLRAR